MRGTGRRPTDENGTFLCCGYQSSATKRRPQRACVVNPPTMAPPGVWTRFLLAVRGLERCFGSRPPLPMSALLAQCASRHQVFRRLSDTAGLAQVTQPRRKRRTPPTAHNACNPSKPTVLPVSARCRARSRTPMEALEGRYAMPAKSKHLQSRRRRNGLVAK